MSDEEILPAIQELKNLIGREISILTEDKMVYRGILMEVDDIGTIKFTSTENLTGAWYNNSTLIAVHRIKKFTASRGNILTTPSP